MNFDRFCKMGRIAAGLFGVAVFAGAAGCGGFGAGDYLVYRIAAPEAKLSGDCQNNPDRTTTFQNGSTVVMYAIAGDSDDVYYLDVGSTVLTGTTTDDGYSFTGNTTETQDVGGNTTVTSKTTLTVTVVDDGDQVSGTFVSVQETSCSGQDCSFVDVGKCTASSTYVGVLIDDSAVGVDPGGGVQP
jgi:hypothetical protein